MALGFVGFLSVLGSNLGADNEASGVSKEPARPPRGYCVRISRAVPRTSRCFHHLIDQRDGNPDAVGKHDELPAANNNGQHQARPANDANHNNIKEELVYVRLETIGSNLSDLATQVINERILLGILDQLLYGPEEAPTTSTTTTTTIKPATLDNIRVEGNNNNNNNELKNLIASHFQTTTTTTRTSEAATTTTTSELNGAQMPRDAGTQTPPSPPRPPPSGTHRAAGTGNLNYYDGQSGQFAGGLEKLEEKCRLSMEKFLCRLVYPSCHFRRADVSALVRPPCREDCLLLRDSLCPNLNWPKFTRALNAAFNVTLMSTINVLDLAVDGDAQAKRDLTRAWSSLKNHTHLVTGAKVNQKQETLQGENYYDGHLNSSIHFYWPHEHSIARCESLPPLQSPFQTTATTSNLYHAQDTLYGHTGANKFDLNKRRNPRRPICSNAHLTKTIALTPREQSLLDSSELTDSECLTTPDGANYEGKLNYTNNMIACQSWASQWPHSHKR